MARLSELVAATARALRVEERTVSMCARHLREAGLIQQKGRGPSAAHMGPTDATNLLLGIMTSDVLQDAPRNVRHAREATFYGAEINFNGLVSDDVPPYPFLQTSNGSVRPIGDSLDALLAEATCHGDPLAATGLPITNLDFFVERPDCRHGSNSMTATTTTQ
jgi:hypothetical protein